MMDGAQRCDLRRRMRKPPPLRAATPPAHSARVPAGTLTSGLIPLRPQTISQLQGNICEDEVMKRACGLVLMSVRWRQRGHAVQSSESRQITAQIITSPALSFVWRCCFSPPNATMVAPKMSHFEKSGV